MFIISFNDIGQVLIIPNFSYSEHTASLLKQIPFQSLFYNAVIHQKYSHEFSMTVLKRVLDSMKSRDLSNATSLLFQHLNAILIDEERIQPTKNAALKFCLTLLRHIVVLLNHIQDTKTRSELKAYIFTHPALKYLEAHLTNDILQFQSLNTFPSEVDVTVSHFFTQMSTFSQCAYINITFVVNTTGYFLC